MKTEELIKNYIDAVHRRTVACDEVVKITDALKRVVRCPICKKKGRVSFCFSTNSSYIMCNECQLCSGEWDTPEKAVEAWDKIGDVLKSKAK